MNIIYNVLSPKSNANIIIDNDTSGKLWLGNYKAALDLDFLVENDISVVINCSPDIPFIYEILDTDSLCQKDQNHCKLKFLETFRIPVFDSLLPNDIALMEQYFSTVLPYILTRLSLKQNVLVHCWAGRQRSAIVVAAILFILKGYDENPKINSKSMKDIIKFIQKQRPEVFSYGLRINFKKSFEKFFGFSF